MKKLLFFLVTARETTPMIKNMPDYRVKSDIFEKFLFLEKKFKHIFFIIGHQRPSNGEYIAGEKDFFGHSWSPGEPFEDRLFKHRENTFMFIKIDRVIRFWSTFFLKFGIDGGQQKIYTFDLSATFVSWNLDRSWKLKSLFLAQAIRYWKTKYAVLMVHP
jgi:hypothetical protein